MGNRLFKFDYVYHKMPVNIEKPSEAELKS